MAQASPTFRPQVAFFDHVYAVIDAVTADEISRCDYLHGFGRFAVKTTVADGETWTGRYLFGRATYVELFAPADLDGPDGTEGSTGLGLSSHDRGGLAILCDRMEDGDGHLEMKRRTLQEDRQAVPWFDYLSPSEAGQALTVWVMEYLRDPSDLQKREHAFLEWTEQNNVARPDHQGGLLSDVSSIELGATVADVAAAELLLKAAGYVVTRVGDRLSASDMKTTITLHCTTPDAVGLRRIEFDLAAPAPAAHVEAIGLSTLIVGPGSRAAWDFVGPRLSANGDSRPG